VITDLTANDLRAFEQHVATLFNDGKIRAPIHLSGGSEDQILAVFQNIREQDWVFSNWRSHYHCLLKGVHPDKLLADILAGRSITLCYPAERVFSSAIVGGNLPIALGVALSIKRRGGDEKVWAFCGDMTAAGGTFHECAQYAVGYRLPIHFVVEDNGKSVCSDTLQTWGICPSLDLIWGDSLVTQFDYRLPYPHSGAGVRVQF
jgi:TPP-dependent pyruvate/acetoin dehydrogenase alpha subunit